jgi:hypothetical protein
VRLLRYGRYCGKGGVLLSNIASALENLPKAPPARYSVASRIRNVTLARTATLQCHEVELSIPNLHPMGHFAKKGAG